MNEIEKIAMQSELERALNRKPYLDHSFEQRAPKNMSLQENLYGLLDKVSTPAAKSIAGNKGNFGLLDLIGIPFTEEMGRMAGRGVAESNYGDAALATGGMLLSAADSSKVIGKIVKPIAKKLKLYSDVPDMNWLKRKQDNVEMKTLKDGTEIPFYQTDQTGRLNKKVKVPTNVLKNLRGINDEQNNIRKESLDSIKDYIKKNGDVPSEKSSIDIFVDQNGKAWVLDGNHRIKAASDLGLDSLDVEVRYWNGGEYVKNGEFSLSNLEKYGN